MQMSRRKFIAARAVGIVQCADRILLIHRRKHGREYYVLPGGSVEEGEEPQSACLREIHEETSLAAHIRAYVGSRNNRGRIEHYFSIGDFNGKVELGSPEKERRNADNEYELEWVAYDQLPSINLQPSYALELIAAALDGE